MSNHLGDTNKMVSDTPRVDAATKAAIEHGTGDVWFLAMKLERELNAANERIQSLIEERDRSNRLADWKWNLRGEFESLLGTDKIEEGIEVVKELKRHIKRLEEAGDAMAWTLNHPFETPHESMPEDWLLANWRKAKEAKL